jgi:uncharacterized membrane protein
MRRNKMVGSWILSFYQLLDRLGFSDPVHAVFAHLPIGLVAGAFIFGWTAILFKNETMTQSAHHCLILALLSLIPTVLFGLTDWEHYYGNMWLTPIKIKVILAVVLSALLLTAFYFGSRRRAVHVIAVPAVYTLCMVTVVFLGWFGARLIYGTNPQATLMPYRSGYEVFLSSCSSCHPNGGNVTDPNKPLTNSPKLRDMDTFISYIRHPDGGTMPAFSPAEIADHQAEELYLYITGVLNVLGAPPG